MQLLQATRASYKAYNHLSKKRVNRAEGGFTYECHGDVMCSLVTTVNNNVLHI